MSTHTITFEDIELTLNGQIWTATGSFVAEYILNPAEPDVGIMNRWIELDGYCDLEAILTLADEDGEELATRHVVNDSLIQKIVAELGEDYISREIYDAL
jgi:hypothetical protein